VKKKQCQISFQKVFDNLEDFLEALPETANFEIQLDMDTSYFKTTVYEGGI
jgi:hypothetical protein